MKIWCDGGNNKVGEYCVITENGKKYEYREIRSTNNIMEYKAMIKALEIAKDGDVIYSDSQLVVNQLEENINSIHVKLSEEALQEIEAIQELQPNPAP